MRLLQLLLGSLLCTVPLQGNIIVFNDGFCDMLLFQHVQDEATLIDIVHAKKVQQIMGLKGVTLEVRMRSEFEASSVDGGPVLLNFTVPDKDPGYGEPAYLVQDYTEKNWAYFFRFIIPAQGHGWDCSEVQLRSPDNVHTSPSLLVLLVFSATLLGSIFSGLIFGRVGHSLTRPETMAFASIVAIFYIRGALLVHDLSLAYLRFGVEAKFDTMESQGDKVWGLHADTPWTSTFFGGRRWDRKDLQVRDLVDNFPVILLFTSSYLAVKALSQRWHGCLATLATFCLGSLFVGFLHEFTLLLPLSYALLNYCLVRLLAGFGRHLQVLIPLTVWGLGLAALILVGKEVTLAEVMRVLIAPLGKGAAAERAGMWLDSFKGEVAWSGIFRFWVLRCISWGVDFQRSLRAVDVITASSCAIGTSSSQQSSQDEQARVDRHRCTEEYHSIVLYLAYLFYPPLYMTGPIITFNAFAACMEAPQRDVVGRDLVAFWLRWFMNAVLFVGFGHFLYTFAIMTNGPLSPNRENRSSIFDSILHFGQDGEVMVWFSFYSLLGLWFKFLVIWRFARGWALADGVAAPENMERCMCNNYSVRGFWRGWHRSFNRWLVRYIFVPLGGSRDVSLPRQFASVSAVFSFVAVWHEPTLLHGDEQQYRLIAWGWLFACFMLPELLAERLCRMPTLEHLMASRPLLTRHLTAFAGACCILLLILANLVGYSYGLDGAKYLLKTLQRSQEMKLFLLAFFAWLMAKTHLMLLLREREVVASVEVVGKSD